VPGAARIPSEPSLSAADIRDVGLLVDAQTMVSGPKVFDDVASFERAGCKQNLDLRLGQLQHIQAACARSCSSDGGTCRSRFAVVETGDA
jgi:hypothetical protein